MTAQFSGSRSAGDRRRRRLVVNGEGTALESVVPDGDAAEMESQLVASEAAGPWVPASELRIWIYTSIIGLFLALLTYSVLQPSIFHQQLAPLTNHLLKGYRPVLVVGVQAFCLALSAQMALLISWYRARCRLDFAGRYRIWPWAAGLLALAAFCSATETHRAFAAVISRSDWLPWRATTVAWLLPFCVAALPILLWVDRDLRNGRSSLYTFRVSAVLGIVWACFEIYHPELRSQTWFNITYLLLPMFASATLFISLWHHARVVAYVCPDPPELDGQSAWSLLLSVAERIGRWVCFWRWMKLSSDDSAKPKRRRKKVEAEAAPAKRKRRAPARRTTRTRSKPADDEEEIESSSEATDDESDAEEQGVDDSSSQAQGSWEDEQENWSQKPTPSGSSKSKGNGRNLYVDNGHQSSAPAPHGRKSHLSWMDDQQGEQNSNASSDDGDEDSYDDQDGSAGGGGSDQLKGLSKRQKREMRRQMRDQERTRGR